MKKEGAEAATSKVEKVLINKNAVLGYKGCYVLSRNAQTAIVRWMVARGGKHV